MKPRILIAHTRYQQRGGEDQVVEAEVDLLQKNGHAVDLYMEDNNIISEMSKIKLASSTFWSTRSTSKIKKIIKNFQPDILHVHNTFPLMSPSIYWAADKLGVPVVQTLHNYRLLCPQAMLLRDGLVCEDCIGHIPWRSIQHKCYHDSATQSAVIAAMLTIHRSIGTYQSKVSAYIALTGFAKNKFISGGMPANRIHIKPNFVEIEYTQTTSRNNGLYVGRLSTEKGIDCLLDAINLLKGTNIDIIGTGPLSTLLESSPQLIPHGWKSSKDVHEAMRNATYLVIPSIWYEGLPVTIVEAFACGLPVIASKIGSLAELISDGETGLLFTPGSASDLAKKIAWANDNPELMENMGVNARSEYEKKFSPKQNYTILKDIYNLVTN